MRINATALRTIATGLLPAILSGMNSAPAAVTSAASRPATGDDDGAMAGLAENARQRDRAGIGGADIKRRHDNERADRIARLR